MPTFNDIAANFAAPIKGAPRGDRQDLVYRTTKLDRALYGARKYEAGPVHAADLQLADSMKGDAEGANKVGREMFSRLHGNPARVGDPAPEWATKLHDIAETLPEFAALRAAVTGDADLSALATAEVIKAVAPQLGALSDNEPPKRPGLPTATDKARAALRSVFVRAAEQAIEHKEALNAALHGYSDAKSGETIDNEDPAGRMKLAQRLSKDDRLRKVLALAGRLRKIAQGNRRVKGPHQREEVVGIERGNDVGRALPSQLALLAHPIARKLVQRSIVERTLPQYKLSGKENQGRGDIVALLDCSGSMSGAPWDYAVAVAIALIGAAHADDRNVTIARFDTRICGSVARLKGGAVAVGSGSAVPVKTTASIGSAVLQVAGWRANGGGTEFTPALTWALDRIADQPRADLIFVTDGQAEDPSTLMPRIQAAKSRGMRIFGLTVNGGSMAPALRNVCDTAIDIDNVDNVEKALASAVTV